MKSYAVVIFLALLATIISLSFAGQADPASNGERGGLIVQPKLYWRQHTPVYAGMFSPPNDEQLIFTGSMAPRCTLILRMPGQTERVPAEQRIVIREEDRGILDRVQLVGARHRNPEGDVRLVKPEDLPALDVKFAPHLPERLVFPSNENCVLYVQVGETDSKFWEEGVWTVSLRFIGKGLVQNLVPGSTNLHQDPDKRNAPSYIWQLQFHSRPVSHQTDRAELLYYEFQHAKLDMNDDDDAKAKAVNRIETLVKTFPKDGRILSEIADVYEQLGRYDSAIEVLKNVEVLLKEGGLSPLPPIVRSRHMTSEQQLRCVQTSIRSRLQRHDEQARSVQ